MAFRPHFFTALSNFRNVYGDGSLQHVANFIGGKVKTNIDAGFFENACAIRMSYVLNKSGVSIPSLPKETVSGSDSSQYIYRVKELIQFLRFKMGKPDKLIHNPKASDFSGAKGLLVFEVTGWTDAAGHATLWDGSRCSDHCYFPRAAKAHFWSLK